DNLVLAYPHLLRSRIVGNTNHVLWIYFTDNNATTAAAEVPYVSHSSDMESFIAGNLRIVRDLVSGHLLGDTRMVIELTGVAVPVIASNCLIRQNLALRGQRNAAVLHERVELVYRAVRRILAEALPEPKENGWVFAIGGHRDNA